MKKLVGAAAAAACMAISAIGLAQPFQTCTDARNFGRNTSEIAVGQVMARVNCNADELPGAEDALVAAFSNLAATWTGTAEMKRCYYEGIYENAVERLRRDYAQCDDPAFQASFVVTDPDGCREAALLLEGVRCAACVWLNEQVIGRLPGVAGVSINDLTDPARLDVSGNAALNGVPVTVRPA